DRPVGDGILDLLGIAGVNVAEGETEVAEQLVEEPEGATVDVLGADDMVAGLVELHYGVQAPGAAAEGRAVAPAFQGGDVALESLTRGIAAAGVRIALVRAELLVHVRGCQVDRGHDGPRLRLRALAGVNRAGAQRNVQVFVEYAGHGLV